MTDHHVRMMVCGFIDGEKERSAPTISKSTPMPMSMTFTPSSRITSDLTRSTTWNGYNVTRMSWMTMRYGTF